MDYSGRTAAREDGAPEPYVNRIMPGPRSRFDDPAARPDWPRMVEWPRDAIALHEAAHVVVGFHFGWWLSPIGVTAQHQDPAAWMESDEPTIGAEVVTMLAGNLAMARAYPDLLGPVTDDMLAELINGARAGRTIADDPRALGALIRHMPDAGDAEIAAAYRQHEAVTVELVSRPVFAASIRRLADVLLRKAVVHHLEARELVDPTIAPACDLASIFARHERVYVGFSGGKESVALASMLEPWRDRVMLLWTNTGQMAPHMRDFVLGYRDRFDVVEIIGPNVLAHWRLAGIPAEVLPFANVMGAAPRLNLWTSCCQEMRFAPICAYLAEQPAGGAFLMGQRAGEGPTPAGLRTVLPETVTLHAPLWHCTERQVLDAVTAAGAALPEQYAHGVMDSLECLICPAQMTAAKRRYLAARYPTALKAAQIAMETQTAAVCSAMLKMAAAFDPAQDQRAEAA